MRLIISPQIIDFFITGQSFLQHNLFLLVQIIILLSLHIRTEKSISYAKDNHGLQIHMCNIYQLCVCHIMANYGMKEQLVIILHFVLQPRARGCNSVQ